MQLPSLLLPAKSMFLFVQKVLKIFIMCTSESFISLYIVFIFIFGERKNLRRIKLRYDPQQLIKFLIFEM